MYPWLASLGVYLFIGSISKVHSIEEAADASELMQWLQTKEEWDREKVCMAELGYIPDEANPEVSPTLLSQLSGDIYVTRMLQQTCCSGPRNGDNDPVFSRLLGGFCGVHKDNLNSDTLVI